MKAREECFVTLTNSGEPVSRERDREWEGLPVSESGRGRGKVKRLASAAAIASAAAEAATNVNFSLVLSVTDPQRLYQAAINMSTSSKVRTCNLFHSK